MPWRLRTVLLTWSFVPTVIALASVAVITFVAYENAAEEQAIAQRRELAYVSAARLREELSKFVEVLEAQARGEEILPDDPVGARITLRQARRRLTVFDGGVVLLDNFGRVVAVEPEQPQILGQDWSDRPFFRQILGSQSVVFSDIVSGGSQEAGVVVIAVPINGTGGEFLGTLAGMFRLGSPSVSALYASIVRLRITEGGSTYLVDGKGRVIYHSDPEYVGKDFPGPVDLQQILRRKSGASRTYSGDGQPVVTAFAPVPGTSWALVTEENWAFSTSSSGRFGQVLLVLLAMGMILPAIGVGLFARQRQAEALERARVEQELRVARVVQQTLLPRELPSLPGWEIAVHWQPARAIGGDFYDFLPLDDNRLALVIGDVTDKGVPAALIMATTRSVLRGAARRLLSPGEALRRSNDLLHPELPPGMFITCLYAILDLGSGQLRFANSGHNLPFRSHNGKVAELRATGMPLGLMPDMSYEECETIIQPGEFLLLYSDGLVEAHNPQREMFGFPRLQALIGDYAGSSAATIQGLLAELGAFTGPGWEQEDDVTLLAIRRLDSAASDAGV